MTLDFEDLAVGAEELTFSIPKLLFDRDTRFRAVLPAEGELRGQAEAVAAEGSSRLLGSFVLRRKAD